MIYTQDCVTRIHSLLTIFPFTNPQIASLFTSLSLLFHPKREKNQSLTKTMDERGMEKKYITTAELRQHNTPSDLWISIQGKVYDVTGWLKDHPGGDLPLLNLAGQDVTDAFVAYHPPVAWSFLDRFYVAHLSDYRVSEISREYRRLVAEFSQKGLFNRKGHGACTSLLVMVVLMSMIVYGVVYTESPVVHAVCAVLMAAAWCQSGFLGHDSGHYNVMIDGWPGLNRAMQVLSISFFRCSFRQFSDVVGITVEIL